VNTAELKARLSLSQDALVEALQAENFELLTEISTERQALIQEMAEHGSADVMLNAWIQEFLTRDREITAQIALLRDEVGTRMNESRSTRQVHLSYLRSDLSD